MLGQPTLATDIGTEGTEQFHVPHKHSNALTRKAGPGTQVSGYATNRPLTDETESPVGSSTLPGK